MKELSIEEKAKAYDEAKDRMSRAFNDNRCSIDFRNEIFPELKESEDERMKKIISDILLIDSDEIRKILNANSILMQDIDAWLEKQGEQKPADKVEPKFKVGDWITMDGWNYHIDEVLKSCYNLSDINGNYTMLPHFSIDDYYRPWTIEDAKDGDVLKEDSCTFIIERMKPDGTAIVHCCLFNDGDFDLVGSTLSFDVDSTYPATKEQRDTLEMVMADAGYTFDFEKKELKKIEQNRTWSEENERMINTVISDLERHGGKEGSCYSEEINFLKSLKDRVQPQPKQEWSTCDEFTIKILNTVCDEYLKISTYKGTEFRHEIIDSQKWLKSLKDRYTWKPSDEQMLAINTAINVVGKGTINGKYLVELQEQLKKLREGKYA